MKEENSAVVHFVGAGPGAKDLITIRGARLLSKAKVCIYAGSLINTELLEYTPKDCRTFDSSQMDLEDILKVMKDAADAGESVVRLHSGDPSLYGAIKEQMEGLNQLGIAYDTCPGVSACFGAAASLNMEYTLPGVSQTLILTRIEGRTGVPEAERIESLASHRSSMAIYLSAGLLYKLSERLIKGGYPPDTPAAIVYKATWPDEKRVFCNVKTLGEAGEKHSIKRTALVLVGDAVSKRPKERSFLYNRHGE